ncbi:SLBB domain-containing protein [Flavobacterium algicola]|uniref:SLBB domain-containing protein n=1 Tax=Flavobacterium algicola TaxID=556529 RepID=UPI001EFDC708|nr:SLBB domain-containing protein [Flavobacterium algicola]MCG9793935.1 SLBB domain-containing protein [Flavobacterium algicola]
MKKLITVILLTFAFFQPLTIVAQDLLKGNDLSSVKVDNLTDAEITKLQGQLKSNNTTIDQVEQIVLAKGMSSSEYSKLKSRLNGSSNFNTSNNLPTLQKLNSSTNSAARKQTAFVNVKVKDSLNALVFGSELFDNPTLDFSPDLQLATPMNYVLGPGDELQISVYGVQLYNATISVNTEGKISIDAVGQLYVSGMTIEAATQKIKNAIANVYSTVASGQSQVSVSLGKIRTIRVTIIGGKQPGNYSISSLASVYNALHLAGGPNVNGSYRNIELIRSNKTVRIIDIYKFLVNGDQSDNIGLKDNDVIRIPSYTNRVTLEGEVKRPGIFEIKAGETFKDLLTFASGFNDVAYTGSVNVTQKTGTEFKVKDIKSTEFNTNKPLSGDVYRVSKILNRFENRIEIKGAVFRPNVYSFYEGMRISNLIAKADGLKEDAYAKRARIIRLKSDLTTEIVQVNLAQALDGNDTEDVLLQKEDIITVYSILDFVEEFKVTIDGEVKNPGEYDYFENLSLNDVLLQAGGLTGSASKRVEVARMIKAEEIDDTNPNKAELFSLVISPENNEQLKNFVLAPYDVISIRKMGVYERPESVTIGGAVSYPGKYVLATKKEKIYDVIMRAGGLTSLANIDGVKIKRPVKQAQVDDLKAVNFNITNRDNDTINSKVVDKLVNDVKFLTIPIDWKSILKKQDGLANVTLDAGDEIFIEKFSEGVKVSGNVLLNSEIPYVQGKSLKYYLNSAGGIDAKGWKRKAYIIYPNGRADVASHFLFFNSYPKVAPGSQIVVPEKAVGKKMTTAEIVSIGSVFVSIAGIITTFLLLNN